MGAPELEPGQAANLGGEPVPPRLASTVMVARGGDANLELLFVLRNPNARFMGGVWVFPGGAVDAADGTGDEGHRAAAARELREETGIVIDDHEAFVPFARWITPAQVKVRFDTVFFVAEMPEGQEPEVDGEEIIDARWLSPTAALDAHRADELELVFPTIKQLESMAHHRSAAELMAAARAVTEIPPIEPRVVVEGGQPRILLPGEPGYARTSQ
jgi:8-oxo-dGTP pyrophosphatase MutT (NUDIX family)